MPPKPEVSREQVLEAAVPLVRAGGMENVNARALAQALGCSTRPLFRLYKNMEALKLDVKLRLDEIYENFMEARMREENRLLSQGAAYVEFAREEKEIFRALFLTRTMAGKSLTDIVRAEWNQRSIENAARTAGLSREGAERLFLNVWLYSHGVASQILSNEIDLPQGRAEELLQRAFEAFAHQEREGEHGTGRGKAGGDGRVF